MIWYLGIAAILVALVVILGVIDSLNRKAIVYQQPPTHQTEPLEIDWEQILEEVQQ